MEGLKNNVMAQKLTILNANPQGHGVNPSEGYNVNPIPADEDMANPLDVAIPSLNGFGGYDDILDITTSRSSDRFTSRETP
ncbi:hypothetical protein V6N13_016797 [Hibiscus sabdariffa]